MGIEASARDLKLRSAKIKSNFDLIKFGVEYDNEEFKSFYEKASGFSKDLNEFSALSQYTVFYFEEGVDTLIYPLLKEVQSNFFFYLDSSNSKNDIESITNNFDKDFNSTKGLTKMREKVIAAMFIEIQESIISLNKLND